MSYVLSDNSLLLNTSGGCKLLHAFNGQMDRQTEFSSLDPVCIPCSAVKTRSEDKNVQLKQAPITNTKYEAFTVFKRDYYEMPEKSIPKHSTASRPCQFVKLIAIYLNFYVSHGSTARFSSKKCYIHFVDNSLLFPTVKEFSKSVNS